ncbi:MAG: TonB-dependent receptor [Ferruginibacter sp.]
MQKFSFVQWFVSIQTALLLLCVNDTIAQKKSLDTLQLGEVVVTGQYKPQSVKNSVYQVRTISAMQLRRLSPSKLQDVLNTQLNIRFSQDLATGGSNINMLGLQGQNVKILIDGAPVIGRQGTSNEININQVDINSIERIEIIEGPMSVIYGADALAGVINIITKKKSHSSFSVTAGVQEETAGKEYGFNKGTHNQFLGLTGNYKRWYATGNIARNLFNGWKDTAKGRELTWHKKKQLTGSGLIGYQTNKLNIYYRLDGLDEVITNPANLPASGQPAVDQDYITDRLMQQLQASYNFNNKLSASTLASYTHFTRQVYSTLFYPDGDIRVATAPGLHSLTTFNGFTFKGTAVYKPSSLISFQPGIDINTESGEGERIKAGVQHIKDYAFFITSEIIPNKKINIRPGIRLIKNSVYDAPPFIPSVNTKIVLTKTLDLRLAYARGFRSPSLRELYYDFFDANHSIIGNPNLEAEHSNSFTGSLSFAPLNNKPVKFKSTLNGFYNDITNMISFATLANSSVTSYMNIDKYKTRGFSLDNNIKYKNLDASFGFAYTGRYNDYKEADKSLPAFKWSGEFNAVISYAFTKIGLNALFNYKFTGKLPYYTEVNSGTQTEIILAETAGYHWADISFNKKLFKLLTINAGIRNLFDITSVNSTTTGTAHSSGGPLPIANGRSLFAGFVFNWEKK